MNFFFKRKTWKDKKIWHILILLFGYMKKGKWRVNIIFKKDISFPLYLFINKARGWGARRSGFGGFTWKKAEVRVVDPTTTIFWWASFIHISVQPQIPVTSAHPTGYYRSILSLTLTSFFSPFLHTRNYNACLTHSCYPSFLLAAPLN